MPIENRITFPFFSPAQARTIRLGCATHENGLVIRRKPLTVSTFSSNITDVFHIESQ
jgi:hypothetical protein